MRLFALALLAPTALLAQAVRDVPTCPPGLPDGFMCVEGRVTSEQPVLECPEDLPEGFACTETLTITRTEGPAPPVEPPPVEPPIEPPIEPPPGVGDHAHFDAVCDDDRAIACRSFRVPEEIGCDATDPSMWALDEEADAMRLTLSRQAWDDSDWYNPPNTDGGMSLDSRRQCRTTHETVTEDDLYYSYQIEFWLSNSYTRTFADRIGWNETLKLITVPNGRGSKELELNVSFSGSDDPVTGHSGRPTHRIYKPLAYIFEEYVENTILRLSPAASERNDRSRQPSVRTAAYDRERPFVAQDWKDMAAGDTDKPALFPTGEWCRYTVHIEYIDPIELEGDDYHAFKMSAYLGCESYETVQFLSSVDRPSDGMVMLDSDADENRFQGVYIEHNSSGPGKFADTGLQSVGYFRNLAIWKGGLIPPGKGPGR